MLLCFPQAFKNKNNPTKKKKAKDSRENNETNKPFLQTMIIPSELNDIQPKSTQVCNCNEIGFDINGIWINVSCTYKFFQGKRMWKVQTGERAPLSCTFHVLTWDDGQYFMPPIIFQQANDYSQDIQFNIPLVWKFHQTTSMYIDRYRWIKVTTKFYNLCGAYPVNN